MKIFSIQLNEYETDPYLLHFFQVIWQFVWLFMCFVRVVNLKLFLFWFAEQFHVHKSYKMRESTMSSIENFKESIDLCLIYLAVQFEIVIVIQKIGLHFMIFQQFQPIDLFLWSLSFFCWKGSHLDYPWILVSFMDGSAVHSTVICLKLQGQC